MYRTSNFKSISKYLVTFPFCSSKFKFESKHFAWLILPLLEVTHTSAGDVEQYSDEEYRGRGRGGPERAGPGARGRRGFSR